MATVLETFFAKLGFEVDESGFANAQAKLAGVGKSILGLGIFSGISVAGIMKLVNGTAAALGAVDRLSQRTGISTDAIQGLSAAGRQFDITAEGMQGSLTSVNNALGAAILREPRAVLMFKRLGLSATDAAGAQKDVVTFLGDVAERMQGLPTAAQARLTSRLGIDPGMIGMLRDGRQAFEELYATASQGAVFPQEDVARAAQFEQMFRRVRGILTTIGRNIGLELMKPMLGMLETITKWWAANGKRMMEDMRGRLKMWIDAFSWLTNIFNQFGQHGNLIVRVIEALGVALGALVALKVAEWIGGILKWFDPWKLALMAIAVLIYLIIEDFLVWKEGGESVIGYFQEHFPGAFEAIRDAVNAVSTAAKELWGALKQFWAENGPAIKEFTRAWLLLQLQVGSQLLLMALRYISDSIKELTALIRILTPVVKGFVGAMNEIAEKGLGERIKTVNKEWIEEIKADLNNAGAFMKNNLAQWGNEIAADWNSLTTRFQNMTGNIRGLWQSMTDGLRSIWEGFMGWLMPWLERIENFFSLFTAKTKAVAQTASDSVGEAASNAASSFADKAKGFAQKAFSWLPSMPAAPALTPAMAGGAPPMVPSSVANNNNQQTQNNNTEVNATINVQAPSPEEAAEMTARKVNDLARNNVRFGQGFDL
jgi:hypothetical protein